MPNQKEQKPKEQKPKEPKPKAKKEDKGVLEVAAEAIGSTLGTIAATVGVAPKNTPPRPKIGKLQKKNKQKLPRKLKKRALKEGRAV